MALDALAIQCLVNEFSDNLIGGRIDKIHQPEKDEIWITIRTYNKTNKLVMSANASHPRIHFTDSSKKNPMSAPMFCMLMRKHLSGGKIIDISQCGFERIIRFDIESYDELGDLTQKHIYVEIMGRHSNIILTNNEDKILDSVKHIDFTVSSVRQVLPGMQYVLPPEQDKIPFISDEIKTFSPNFNAEGIRVDKALLDGLSGISPLTAREIVYTAINKCGVVCGELTTSEKGSVTNTVRSLSDKFENNEFTPCIIRNATSVMDFSSISINQYEQLATVQYYDSMNEVLDVFYTTKDNTERMKQRSADLLKLLHNNLERVSKKIVIQQNTISDAKRKDDWKKFGDLLTSNLYQINHGDLSVVVDDYYIPDCPPLKITLSPMLSPSQNAQMYYKKYNKAKIAEVEAAKQLENSIMEKDYLESTLVSAQNAVDESDINAIRTELSEQGYLKKKTVQKKNKKQAISTSKPQHYVSSDGFDIYVGKNNTQNDYLTLRFANAQDMWFHTKNIHGSHTIIKLGVDKDIPDTTIIEAASLAAYYSKARESSQVPVDYTQVKNVKKPSGAKPGMVIYDHYNTVYVTPSKSIATE